MFGKNIYAVRADTDAGQHYHVLHKCLGNTPKWNQWKPRRFSENLLIFSAASLNFFSGAIWLKCSEFPLILRDTRKAEFVRHGSCPTRKLSRTPFELSISYGNRCFMSETLPFNCARCFALLQLRSAAKTCDLSVK